MNDRGFLDSIMRKNALRAKDRASLTVKRVNQAIGFVPRGF
jgi:hypothetical protein